MGSFAGRIWRILFTGVAFLLFFAGAPFVAYVALPFCRLFAPSDAKANRSRSVLSKSWGVFHWFMRVTKTVVYRPRDAAFVKPAGAYVLVANHPTLIDVTAIIAAEAQLTTVVKASLFRFPPIRSIARACGYIESAGGPLGGAEVIGEIVARLQAGIPVLVFPEGTRSPLGALGPVHLGAFKAAAIARVPVLIGLVTCEPPTLYRGNPWYAVPDRTAALRFEVVNVLASDSTDAIGLRSLAEQAWALRLRPEAMHRGE